MDSKEVEVAIDLLMKVEGIDSLVINDGVIEFWYEGITYSYHDLASLVRFALSKF